MEKIDLRSLNFDELCAFMEELGEKKFRAGQVYDWLHVKLASSVDEMTNLSKDLREKLKSKTTLVTLKPVEILISQIDGTSKYLFELPDGNIVESVLMLYKHGNSVCISTQVGCRMGCRFCASTLDGRVRNLEPSEMLEEVYEIQKLSGKRVSNVVLMGSGEPLDNFDNVLKFLDLISNDKGLNISERNLTLSTCGIVPKIYELADKELAITLAISLHAADDETRKSLMPIANKYSIKEIMDACDYYYKKTGRRISFEYSLVSKVNDNLTEAKKLALLVEGKNCHINLIPVNPIKERDYKQGTTEEILKFKNFLEKKRINVTIRREMGRDINGACGQLRKSFITKRENGLEEE